MDRIWELWMASASKDETLWRVLHTPPALGWVIDYDSWKGDGRSSVVIVSLAAVYIMDVEPSTSEQKPQERKKGLVCASDITEMSQMPYRTISRTILSTRRRPNPCRCNDGATARSWMAAVRDRSDVARPNATSVLFFPNHGFSTRSFTGRPT